MTTALIFGPQDMEVGDLSEWDTSAGTIAASTVTPITGTYSLRGGNNTLATGYVTMTGERPVGSSGQGIYAVCNYRPKVTPGGAPVRIMSVGAEFGVWRDTDGKLFLTDDAGTTKVKQATAVTNGTVYALIYRLDFCGQRQNSALGRYPGIQRFWQDGVLQATQLSTRILMTLTEYSVFFGDVIGKSTWDEVSDDHYVYSLPSYN